MNATTAARMTEEALNEQYLMAEEGTKEESILLSEIKRRQDVEKALTRTNRTVGSPSQQMAARQMQQHRAGHLN